MDEEHARTAKLRKLMRDFNRLGDEKSAFALELELTTNRYHLHYPVIEVMVKGEKLQSAMAIKRADGIVVTAFTSKHLMPASYLNLPLGHAAAQALWENARIGAISILHLDPYSLHATGITWRKGNMTFVPLRSSVKLNRAALKAAEILLGALEPGSLTQGRPGRRTRNTPGA
jgi:hypothetical protein